jgi:hypothetical protein
MRPGLKVPNWREDNSERRPKSELRKLSIANITHPFLGMFEGARID